MTALNSQQLEQTLSAIAALDLTPIKFKATRQEDGYGWTPEHADLTALAYKRYLALHAKYPELTLAPDQDVDRFWHLHILDTRKYAADCEAIFGYFLHHYPYLGLRGEDDALVLQAAFATTQALHAKEFGDDVRGGAAAWCGAESGAEQAAWCGAESGAAKQAAWCGAESAAKKAAWCGADASTTQQAAWCGAESAAPKAAWCGAEAGATKQAAWCGAESAAPQQAAWCGVDQRGTATAAWCGVDQRGTPAAPTGEAHTS